MARDWRRAVVAILAGTMLSCACPFAAHAQAEAEAAEAGAQSKAAAKRRQDPAEAQRTVEAALRQLQAGRAEQAVQSLSTVLGGGNLPPAIMAKAFLVRGMAHRQEGQTAQAISDLTSALWLKGGLGGDDRSEALRERSAAYAAAGLSDPGDAVGQPAAQTASSGNWLSNLLGGGNLFGAASSPSPPPRPPPPKAAPRAEPARPSAATTAAIADSWTTETETRPAAPPPPSAPKARAAPAKAPPASSKAQAAKSPPPRGAASAKPAQGRHLIQLGAVRSEKEALALAAKAKRAHSSMLAGRGQSIDRAVFGNMGAFYRARFGPFASAQETKAACAKLQGSGIDCLPVSR